MNVDNRSLFEQNESQEMTWESKHIRFFLTLPKLGRARVRKIIETNPDVYSWDKNAVINQLGLESLTDSLPEQIPELADLDSSEVINFTERNFPENHRNRSQAPRDAPTARWNAPRTPKGPNNTKNDPLRPQKATRRTPK